MNTPLLQLDQLCKDFGRVAAVQNISLSINAGEFVALVGPNGAGKTTTIKMITGQMSPTSGALKIADVSVQENINQCREMVGYVPEFPVLFDYLSAREMLEFVMEIRKVPQAEREGRLSWAISLMGLGDGIDRQIREYSQGMLRKTAIATALISKPKLIVLDESLNGLDPPSVERVIDALEELRASGSTVILSSHVLDTLTRVASRFVVLREGKLVYDGVDASHEMLLQHF